MQEKVEEFMTTFKQEVRTSFTGFDNIDKNIKDLRLNLIKEEFKELLDGIKKKDIVEIADAVGDSLYVAFGTAAAYGMTVVVKKYAEVDEYYPEQLVTILEAIIEKMVINQFWEHGQRFDQFLSD